MKIEGVSFKTQIFDVTVTFEKPEMVVVLGCNGAGKTSLFRLMAGLEQPTQGRVILKNKPITVYTPQERSRLIGYLPQKTIVTWPLTGRDIVALGRLPHDNKWYKMTANNERDHEKALQEAITFCKIESLLDRHTTTLSGGEQARLFLARVLATQPEILILDEPLASLDPYYQLYFLEKLRALARQKRVILSLHDVSLALKCADRIIMMHQGKKVFDGTSDLFKETKQLEKIYRLRWVQGMTLSLF